MAVALMGLASCGGTPPTVTVNVTNQGSTLSLDAGQAEVLLATVINDPTSDGVAWSLSGPGSLTSPTNTSVTYNAPASLSAAATASVTATSISTPAATASCNFKLAPVPSITTTSLPNGVVGTAYSGQVTVSGGSPPFTWSVKSGALPANLSLNSSTGAISGTPTATGKSTFTVQATDSSGAPAGPLSAQQSLSITINNAGLTITTTSLPTGLADAPYSASVAVSGGTSPYTWSITSGSLPGGLSFDASTATISGVPATAGTFNFTVTVTDSSTPQQSQSQPLSIIVYPVLAITTTSLPNATINIAYSATVAVSGGTSPYTWSVTSGVLPANLSLNASTGAITGMPTATGTSTFTVKVADSSSPQQVKTRPLSLTVNGASGGALTITTTSLPTGAVGTDYSGTVGVSGGTSPYTWSVTSGALPAWATLSSSTGVIAGIPAATGTSSFTIAVTDSSTPQQTQSEALAITINPPAAACTSSGSEFLLTGQYAFSLSGYNATGFLAAVGSFTADGSGHITAGEVDSNGVLGVQTAVPINPMTSSYSIGSDNRGCATIATSFGTFTTRFALGSLSSAIAQEGRMIEWESASDGAFIADGRILQQTPVAFTTGVSGNYVWQSAGVGSAGERFAGAGALAANNGSFSGGEEDLNDAGALSHFTGVTGAYSGSIDSNGRFTGTLGAANGSTSNLAFYMVSSSQFLSITVDPPAAHGVQVGEVDQQSGPFDNTWLNGNAVYYLTGLSASGGGGQADLGLASANGVSALTVTDYEDEAGAASSSTFTCTYLVAANGRTTLSGGAPCVQGPVLYLTASNTAFLLGTGSGVQIGQIEPQAAGPFTDASVSGNFYLGDLGVVNQAQATEVAALTLNGSGGVSGTSDGTSTTSQEPDQAISLTIAVNSNGSFSSSNYPGVIAGIVISSTELVLIDNQGSTYPAIAKIKH